MLYHNVRHVARVILATLHRGDFPGLPAKVETGLQGIF
jgi:hypothetical protein